ncbi:hypothetical protein HanRHA438_Chr15g0696551 [Helianthus annuus]|nr:hypothetical protein HanRHA438_Chr15g0696551 [Helianthus annuus]
MALKLDQPQLQQNSRKVLPFSLHLQLHNLKIVEIQLLVFQETSRFCQIQPISLVNHHESTQYKQ